MVRVKIDNRIRVLVENGVIGGHRSMFVVVGKKARDQIVTLHQILTKAVVGARPSVLWCYKKDLGFSSSKKKRQRENKKKVHAGILNPDVSCYIRMQLLILAFRKVIRSKCSCHLRRSDTAIMLSPTRFWVILMEFLFSRTSKP